MNEKLMAQGVTLILEGMGVKKTDPNFQDTPQRVARLYKEMLTPQKENSWAVFPSRSADLVLLRNHRVIAICPHHLMPVELRCYVAYVPHELTVGLSKLARVVEGQLTAPVMQEDLTQEIAEELHSMLKPKGVGIVIAGTHGCMRFRGVETEGDVVTSCMKGVFLLNPAARQELLSLIGRP